MPYLVHTWLPGATVEQWVERVGPLATLDAVPRLTQIAAALDFAAAAGVHHGLLTPNDIIIGEERSGVTGFGLAQVLAMAGIPPPDATDDVRALAAMASLMLGRPVRGPVADAIAWGLAQDGGHASSALAFVARLREAADAEPPAAPQAAAPIGADLQAGAPGPVGPELRLGPPEPVGADLQFGPREPVETDLQLDPREPVGLEAFPSEYDDVGRAPAFVAADTPARHSPGRWFAVAAALAVGLLTGFAGGFVAGQREAGQREAAPRQAVRQDAPAPTTGSGTPAAATHQYTEAPVRDEPAVVVEAPVVPPERGSLPVQEPPASAPAAADRAPTAPREPARTGPGTLTVVSRPSGAQVFFDGRLVGVTPLSLPDVVPGSHGVRLALPDHRPWVTTVVVAPGTANRVAASLER